MKSIGIVINRNESINYIIPKSLPIEISYKQIKIFGHKTFILYFNKEKQQKEFLNQIGIK